MINKFIQRLLKLKEEWNRIITVARKPDRELYKINLRITLLIITLFGILAYLIQLALLFI